ncbi:tetratricopeptide repeat protein [Leptolyngbya sp. FACHB-321]|uniref:tetratricopeptide repeat protein n=1 Tax=Leptolyngbya sp. FACHB-321 TaxID=2692807 RepID=UPI001689D1E8|nr:tetratricopeptide repeat protein [Leptolyngbya sp. FACHB-321]MBD2038955.1 tetratricopeptide repeat protein [Leptolyngbya sp. FACHB-321]
MTHPPESLAVALQWHRSGRIAEAEAAYRHLLEQQPNAIDVLNLLGALVYQQQRFEEAIACFERVLLLQPDSPDAYNSMGIVLKGQGKLEDAVTHYQQALARQPDHVEALNNLGNALKELGKLEDAIAAYQQALRLRPAYPEAHNNLGIALKDQGQLEDAIVHYREALLLKPNYSEAHHNLAVALQRQGTLDEAIDQYQQAIALKPDYPEAHHGWGNTLQQQGEPDAAIVHYQQAIALKPTYAEAHHGLATALQQQGKLEEAVIVYRQALTLREAYPEAHNNLGNALQEQGQLEAASAHYQRALTLRPQFAEAHSNLGAVLRTQKQYEAAIAQFQQALALRPDYAEVHNNLGNTYQDQGKPDAAIDCYRRALAINPNSAEIHSNLGNLLQQDGEFEEAFEHLEAAIAIQPHYLGAYNNLGIARRNYGDTAAAFTAYERALAIDPAFVEAQWNKALTQLFTGDLAQGFAGYEWRLQWSKFREQNPVRSFQQPRWDGTPLDGKTILLYTEQGMGDTLQFIRYASIVAALGGHVIVECQPLLINLLQGVTGIQQLIPEGSPLPSFDVHAPLLSLPYILGTTLETIPADIPYLQLPLSSDRPSLPTPASPLHPSTSSLPLKIGIVWQGNPLNPYNRSRSCPLEQLLTLAALPDVRLYSLQKEPSLTDQQQLQASLQTQSNVHDLRAHLHDFVDTAALIQQLDLIIAVDTSIAHLAGALGKPVWLLLPFAPDWRWMQQRHDSPWYPTMRLFRQPVHGDWESVITQVQEALREKGQKVEGRGQKAKGKRQKVKGNKRSAVSGQPVAIRQPIPVEKQATAPSSQRSQLTQTSHVQTDNTLLPTPYSRFAAPHSPLPQALKNAVRHHQAGRYREAEQLCHQVLQAQEDYADAWHLLGMIAHQEQRFEAAIAFYRRALTTHSDNHDTHNNLAVALQESNRIDEAIAHYEKAIALKPDFADAHNNFANALRHKGLMAEAIAHYEQAITIRPNYADAHNNLGLIYFSQGNFEQAAACYRQAIAMKPDFPQAHNHLGNALKELGDFDAAIAHYKQAITLKPDYAKAFNNWGNIFRDRGELQEAVQYYNQATAIEPNFAEAHWNKALTLLLNGDLLPGFAAYEWRWQVKLPTFQPMRPIPQPRWDGSPLNGKTIFLHAEQGMGDMIQFVRYVPLVAQRGGHIILECHAPLMHLFQGLPNVAAIVSYGSPPPPFDVHAPLMSLPHILGTTVETIPATTPYLQIPAAASLAPRSLPRFPPSSLKIGIVWEGNPQNPYNRTRACPLDYLLPLADRPNVDLYSLQKEPSSADLARLQAHPHIHDLREHLHDFVDTAVLMQQLDLVIAVDTSAAHLAGALGRPIWLLLPFAPDWRWLLAREDSIWYPTMRIFRQPSYGDWAGAIEQIQDALVKLQPQRGRETEPQRQEAVSKQKAEGRRQKAEGRLPRASADGRQKAEGRGQPFASRQPTSTEKQATSTSGQQLALAQTSPVQSHGQTDSTLLPTPSSLLSAALQHYHDGKFTEAERVCREILQQEPDQVAALQILSVALCRAGQSIAALPYLQKVVQLQPEAPEAWSNLGSALQEQGSIKAAIAAFNRAIALKPDHADAHYNLAVVLQEQDRLEDALFHSEQAIALKPDFADAYYNQGFILRRLGQLEAAIARYRTALQLAPQSAGAHKNLGHALLLTGDLQQGFQEYEWRWQQPGWTQRSFAQPLWDGSPLQGKTILLHAEQGLGDTIQFIRYVSLVRQAAFGDSGGQNHGGRVIVECQPSLLPLLETVAGIDQLIAQDSPLPAFDVHAPLLSLPHILGTTLATIPADIPYLQASRAASAPQLPLPHPSPPQSGSTLHPSPLASLPLKVGIVWTGNPAHKNNPYRSCTIEPFRDLCQIPGVCFYSLQKGAAVNDLQAADLPIQDLSQTLADFADTAAAIAQLDLVITIDTAVAHLAGALGKPVWLLLSFAPDWRWLLERDDSPWYPTMRLFRQRQRGSWQGVFEQVTATLEQWVERRKHV